MVVRIYAEGAVILDRAGCIGSELAPRIEPQAAHFAVESLYNAVIVRSEDKTVIGVSPDNGGNFEEMLSRQPDAYAVVPASRGYPRKQVRLQIAGPQGVIENEKAAVVNTVFANMLGRADIA